MSGGIGPFEAVTYPKDPTMPEAAPAGYVTPTQPDGPPRFEPPRTAEQIEDMRGSVIEMVLRKVVEAVLGFFSPADGSAFSQWVKIVAAIPFTSDFAEFGNKLWNGLFDIFTGFFGSGGIGFNQAMQAGTETMGAVSGTQPYTGSSNPTATTATTRFTNVATTGAISASGVAGTTSPGTNTAVYGSAVGTSDSNAQTNPTFSSASSILGGGIWSWFSGGHT